MCQFKTSSSQTDMDDRIIISISLDNQSNSRIQPIHVGEIVEDSSNESNDFVADLGNLSTSHPINGQDMLCNGNSSKGVLQN